MAQTLDHEHPHEHPHGHPDYEERFKKMEERIKSLEETVHRLVTLFKSTRNTATQKQHSLHWRWRLAR